MYKFCTGVQLNIAAQGLEFDRYRLTSVLPIPIPIPILLSVSVSVRSESNRYWYRLEINNKLYIGISFGIGWKCNKVSIGLISVNNDNK